MPAVNEVVPSRFDWAIIAASCIASLCGCGLAVELLHRRGTGVRSKRSWAETITCAICLGLIGIWCMHFIGNRAIVLGDGSDNLQLVYSPGFSAFSAFMPIIILTLAFAVAELQFRTRLRHSIALIVTGTGSGFSVVGMHYIGNLGISNYDLHYAPGPMAGSFVIAVADCLTVMVLFYTWREAWISHWPRRLLCAAFLAVGISSMHFVASTHCIYRFKHYSEPNAVHSRNVQIIVAGVLCAAAAVTVGIFLLMSHLRGRLRKQRSKKVMLNCAMFHPDGRLLVTTEGMLPAQEITDKYHHRTFNEDFDTHHPVFHWIFRASRNWTSVSEFIPKMKSHINALRADGSEDTRPGSPASSVQFDSETYRDYAVIFRERFCVAAANLAASMNTSVALIGVLFDKIIDTGLLVAQDGARHGDLEMATLSEVYGTGQLLFLTRQLDEEDTDKLINSGFKFATIEQVGHIIANTMQIPLSALQGHVADLRRYIDIESAPVKTGTWLSCFAMISNVRNFDIAVKTSYRDQLPDSQIMPEEPVEWQFDLLRSMHKKTYWACVTLLRSVRDSTIGHTNREQNFAIMLLRAFTDVAAQIPPSWLEKAVFYGEPLQAHFSEPLGTTAPLTVLYSFVAIPQVNASFEDFTDITPVPLSFYKARQTCYPGSPNHTILSHEIHQEFTALLARKAVDDEGTGKKLKKLKKLSACFPKVNNKTTCQPPSTIRLSAEDRGENSSRMSEEINMMDMFRQPNQTLQQFTHPAEDREATYGGILVNNNTVVQSDNKTVIKSDNKTVVKSENKSESSMEIRPNSPPNVFDDPLPEGNPVYDGDEGKTTAVATASQPERTFVDELIEFAKAITNRKNWFGGSGRME